jgi:O-antigen/teichoic acid export membrane protein
MNDRSVTSFPPSDGPRGLSLKVNFSWTLLGNVVYSGCQWGMLIVLAKLGSAAMVGQFALGLAVVSPIIVMSMLCLRSVQATDARREYAFGDYVGLRLATTAMALAVVGAIGVGAGYGSQAAWIIAATGLAAAPELMSDVVYGLLQQHERLDKIAVSMLLKGPLSLAAMAVAMWLTHSVLWGIAAIAAARTVVLLSYDFPVAAGLLKNVRFPLAQDESSRVASEREGGGSRRRLWRLARLAWLTMPLGVVTMLLSLQTSIPRYFVEGSLGESGLGIFAGMAYLIIVGTTVIQAVGQSASPRLARYYATGDLAGARSLLTKLLGMGLLVGFAGVAVAALAGRTILSLLYTAEFSRHADVLILMMVAGGISYVGTFLGCATTAARYFKTQVPLNVVTTTACFVACRLLVPGGGIRGAAVALVITALVQFIGLAGIVRHIFVSQSRQRRQGDPSECLAAEGG